MSLQAKKLAILKCSITCIIENMQIKKNSSDTYLFFFDIESVKKVSVKSKRCRLIFIKIRSVCKRITHIYDDFEIMIISGRDTLNVLVVEGNPNFKCSAIRPVRGRLLSTRTRMLLVVRTDTCHPCTFPH